MRGRRLNWLCAFGALVAATATLPSAPATAMTQAQASLTLELRAKRHQEAERLRAVATCSLPCALRLHAFGEVPDGRFKSRTTTHELAAGVPTTVRIRFKPNVLRRIDDETGRARLMARAAASDEVARDSVRVRLEP